MASGNPLISQGTLNRLRASVVWGGFPSLNVTPSYLGKQGIRLSLDGESTTMHPSLTGTVPSPEPYMAATLVMTLLKSQGLSDLYKKQMELNALIGDGVVRPDAATLGTYQIYNCAIESVRELDFSGASPDFAVTVKGFYVINNALWGL